ncbi:protein PLANT CADMIUM RESISTANCE 10 [Selaginella moellendorffii]|nr:protein PLANT CADMIUM RESISTANCE 10 [Selaginella moellendorffii]|eukprot:XP_002971358.2 protein PLANT CADMIUM RESISTANCE 10 [Selaginella moellendorffii]
MDAPELSSSRASYQPLAAEDGTVPFHQHERPLRWTSGICACSDDIPSCCLGLFCPCILFGRNVETLEDRPWVGPCVMHLLLWGAVTGLCCALTEGTALGVAASCVSCYACGYRKTLRDKYNLEDAPCGDFLTHLCCHPCAVCQEYREMKERGTYSGIPVTVAPGNQVMV